MTETLRMSQLDHGIHASQESFYVIIDRCADKESFIHGAVEIHFISDGYGQRIAFAASNSARC